MGPKRSREDMESSCSRSQEANCPHKLGWARNRTGTWKLNLEKSTIQHKEFCSSGQKVTQFELVHDPEFVKHVTLEKNTTDKKVTDSSLGNWLWPDVRGRESTHSAKGPKPNQQLESQGLRG